MIYMDHHATTPVDPRVVRAMVPFFSEKFGNAASLNHRYGKEAHEAVQRARAQIARLINAEPSEIIFTSGATESNNLALKGAAGAAPDGKNHLLTLSTEHKSVLDPFKRLALSGFEVTHLPVQKDGLVDVEELKRAITPRTILISILFAHNEIGVLQPIAEIGRIAREKGILFHSDAAQALGKVPIDVRKMNLDLLSMTAHKIYGPKGVGALYARRGTLLAPQIDGGGHEGGMRSGTLNVPGIVGFGKACEICRGRMKKESARLLKLRNRLLVGLLKIPGMNVNGSLKHRLPNNLNVSFPGVESGELLKRLKNVALSSGSACLSTSPEPSYVLKALGVSENLRRSAVRFGLGRFNTEKEVDAVLRDIIKVLRRRKNGADAG
ncbi:MAG: cysteine desulfurase [Candidatus Omnitrophica bacterium]|nr:cysteine desulfurase [Candidatus Omnitrophota bacterium]